MFCSFHVYVIHIYLYSPISMPMLTFAVTLSSDDEASEDDSSLSEDNMSDDAGSDDTSSMSEEGTNITSKCDSFF